MPQVAAQSSRPPGIYLKVSDPMTDSPITRDTMRADIARIIGEDPSEIGDEDSLIDLGLDSIRVMTLIQRWGERGLKLDFARLAEKPTLAHWWSIANQPDAG